MRKISTLNLFKINIQVLNFMLRVINSTISSALQEKFPLIRHNYPFFFSQNIYKKHKLHLRIMKFVISARGHRSWNKLTAKETKGLSYDKRFKNVTKNLLLSMKTKLHMSVVKMVRKDICDSLKHQPTASLIKLSRKS